MKAVLNRALRLVRRAFEEGRANIHWHEPSPPAGSSLEACQRKLQDLRVRWTLVLLALKLFYMSLGSFAGAALISLFGSVFTASGQHLSFNFIALLGLLAGTVGVAGLVTGCTIMMRETRLAIKNLEEETRGPR